MNQTRVSTARISLSQDRILRLLWILVAAIAAWVPVLAFAWLVALVFS